MEEEFEDRFVELAEFMRTHKFGKYRGIVTDVAEGDDLGYISVIVHEVFGEEFELPRVAPSVPFAGKDHGLVALPEIDDGVWIEFEAGNISKPIWTGFWWADGEMPEPKGKLVRTFITTAGNKLILDDDESEVILLHSDGAEMKMTGSDITLSIGNAKVKMEDGNISLQVGETEMSPKITISSSEISLANGTTGTIKISSSGVDIGNGAVKTM